MNKKVIPFVILMAMTGCLSACGRGGGGGGDTKTTTIEILNFGGGVGFEWIVKAGERFSNLHKETAFEPNKKGVVIKHNDPKNIDETQMSSSKYQLYFVENGKNIQSLVSGRYLANIDDVVKGNAYGETNRTIEDKIDVDLRDSLKVDGHYYALPHYEWYPGVTYMKDLFDANYLYFADPSEPDSNVVTKTWSDLPIGTYRFVKDSNTKKSLGNDGIPNTEDDGLPSSLFEFIALCEYMKGDFRIEPIIFPGDSHTDYSNYLLQGLLSSLVGKDGIRLFYDLEGNANVVTGFSSTEELFFKGSGIPAPIYSSEAITSKTGYKVRQTLERYYTVGLMTLFEKRGYFPIETSSDAVTNVEAQRKFLIGKKAGGSNKDFGMLCEGNYWVNEATDAGLFEEIYQRYGTRTLGWMSLPTSYDTPVTSKETGKSSTLMDTGYSYCLVNNKFKDDSVMAAVKEFLKFLYSDQELSNFTSLTGVCKAGFDYDYSSSSVLKNLTEYQQQVLKLKKNNGVVYSGSLNPTFIKSRNSLVFGIAAEMWQPGNYKSIIEGIRGQKSNPNVARICFEQTWISPDKWESSYWAGNN